MSRKTGKIIGEVFAVFMSLVLFGIPFWFVIVNSFKNRSEASKLNISWPTEFNLLENYRTVLETQDGIVLRAFLNSTILTVVSIAVLIVVCAMAGFILQRRKDKASPAINFIILSGLMIPPAVVPTIWILMNLGLFKTMPGLILVEVALGVPFSSILYKGFMATVPREIDESAVIDGCGPYRMFFSIIMPLLKPVTSTVIVLSAVTVFNDFANPLYFLPGAKNATVQLTLYNFMSQFVTSWNLLFADVVLISLPPLILFIFFNNKIVAGMTAGAVKG